MASGSPSDSCKWLLVEWKSGGRAVVYIKSVVSPLEEELKIDDMIVVNRRGEHEEAKLVARARERVRLDAMVNQSLRKASSPTAGPSTKREEEPEEFCESASSWVPSDDDATQSADSDEIPTKKIKLERCKRQYPTRRVTKKKITPSHKATPVIPKSMQQTNTSKVMNRKRPNKDSLNLSRKKSLPNSEARRSALQNGEGNKTVTINLRGIRKIEKTFKVLFKIVANMKKNATAAIKQRTEEPTAAIHQITEEPTAAINQRAEEQVPMLCKIENMEETKNLIRQSPIAKAYRETLKILNQTEPSSFQQTVEDVRDAPEENSDNTEFNRSDDNVLITNKFTNAAIKTVQHKVPENQEWVPIGSGKTLIHKDKFKKVNWKSYTIATRTLLLAAFPRRVLATHSLTGKKSPAFQNKPAKMCLDPKTTTDVIYEIMDRFNVRENLVRSIITTKCADECKMWKSRTKKMAKKNESIPPPPPPPSPALNNNVEGQNVA